MKHTRLIAGLCCLCLLTMAVPARAQNITTDACVGEMYTSLFQQQLFFRSVLFGQKKSSELARGAIRYDSSMEPWMKTGDSQWESYDPDSALIILGDTQMESNAYPPKKRGILEIKKATTSELLPSLLQAVRAFQCRLRSVCQLAVQSRVPNSEQKIKVQVDGCVLMEANIIHSCRNDPSGSGQIVESQANVQVDVCEKAAQDILEREMSIVKLTISYDASYRSFLQFAGIVQGFGDALKSPILDVLAGTVQSLQHFNSVPCFSAQCDE